MSCDSELLINFLQVLLHKKVAIDAILKSSINQPTGR